MINVTHWLLTPVLKRNNKNNINDIVYIIDGFLLFETRM